LICLSLNLIFFARFNLALIENTGFYTAAESSHFGWRH